MAMSKSSLKDKVLEIVVPGQNPESSTASVEYQYVTINIKTLSAPKSA